MPALHDNDVTVTLILVVMLLQTVIKVVYNFCFQSSLKNSTDYCQTERPIQQDAWGSARTARLSTMPLRNVHKCLKSNNGHLITLQI